MRTSLDVLTFLALHSAAQLTCDPSGIGNPDRLSIPYDFKATSDYSTGDPRVFGPYLWRSIHTIASNYPCPPTEQAYQACLNFTYALPYMIPCSHCGWHFADFILLNKASSNKYADNCMGSRANEKGEDESLCLSPEEACKSQDSLMSFFVRAHNTVNNWTHPCESRWTVQQAFDQYKTLRSFCSHNTVIGKKQICRGFYCPNDGPLQLIGGCSCGANVTGPTPTKGNLTYGQGFPAMGQCFA